jgi:hypothetical protein
LSSCYKKWQFCVLIASNKGHNIPNKQTVYSLMRKYPGRSGSFPFGSASCVHDPGFLCVPVEPVAPPSESLLPRVLDPCLRRATWQRWVEFGDYPSVCLLGGDVPFVLRETENSADFTLLGDSHVHGIMDRELWKLAKDEWTWFGWWESRLERDCSCLSYLRSLEQNIP